MTELNSSNCMKKSVVNVLYETFGTGTLDFVLGGGGGGGGGGRG